MDNPKRRGDAIILKFHSNVRRPFGINMAHIDIFNMDVGPQLIPSRPLGHLNGPLGMSGMDLGAFPKEFGGPPQCTGKNRDRHTGQGDNNLVIFVNDGSYPKKWSNEYIRRATGGALFVVGIISIILVALAISKKTNFPRNNDRHRSEPRVGNP